MLQAQESFRPRTGDYFLSKSKVSYFDEEVIHRFRPRIGDYFLSKEHVDLNLSKGIQRFRPRTGDYFFIPTLYSYDN